jgi:SRSO17 transposase
VAYSRLTPVPSHTLVDRELDLPADWCADAPRRREAGIPDAVGFATQPELARRMLARLGEARLPAAWVTGDSVYGGSGP